MKRKLAKILLSFAFVVLCCFGFTACKKTDAKLSSIKVELVNDNYTMSSKVITKEFGDNYQIESSDFKVTAIFDDDSTKELSLKTDTVDGFTFSSTIPTESLDDGKTPIGDYVLTFGYADIENVEIDFKVTKKAINTSDLTWSYTSVVYNGEFQSPKIEQDLTGIVNIDYSNENDKKYVNEANLDYIATATLSLLDTEHYALVGESTINCNWRITKATIDVPSISLVNYKIAGLGSEPETFRADLVETNKLELSDKHISYEIREIIDGGRISKIETENAGTYWVEIVLTYDGQGDTEDEKNQDKISYRGLSPIQLTWQVLEYVIQLPENIQFVTKIDEVETDINDCDFVYNGENYSIALKVENTDFEELNEFINIDTYQFVEKNAGTYTKTVRFSVKEDYQNNYLLSYYEKSVTWTISKPEITPLVSTDYTLGDNLYDDEFDNGEWNLYVLNTNRNFSISFGEKLISGSTLKYGDALNIVYGVENASGEVEEYNNSLTLAQNTECIVYAKVSLKQEHVNNVDFTEQFIKFNITVQGHYFKMLRLNGEDISYSEMLAITTFKVYDVIEFSLLSDFEYNITSGDEDVSAENNIYQIYQYQGKNFVISLKSNSEKIFELNNIQLYTIQTLLVNETTYSTCEFGGSSQVNITNDMTEIKFVIDKDTFDMYCNGDEIFGNIWIKYNRVESSSEDISEDERVYNVTLTRFVLTYDTEGNCAVSCSISQSDIGRNAEILIGYSSDSMPSGEFITMYTINLVKQNNAGE